LSIQLNIDAIDASDLLAQLTTLAQALAGNTAHINSISSSPLGTTARGSTEAEAKTTRSRKTAEPKAEQVNETPAETGNANDVTADAAASTSEASAPAAEGEGKKTYADVRAAMLKLTTAKSRDAAIELLAQYKVGKAQELTEDQYEGFIAAAIVAATAE